ncbi:MAG: hypothetical protein ABSE08_12715, partial [Syntrophobacteraceae bacterium]
MNENETSTLHCEMRPSKRTELGWSFIREMLGANPKGPGFASPFRKGGSRGILKAYIALETQNLP